MRVMVAMESWGYGGTETYVAGLVRLLINSAFDVDLVLLNAGLEGEVNFLPHERVRVVPISKLTSYLKSNKPDVVNLHLYSHLLPIALLCKLQRLPTVTTLHMPINSWGWRHRLWWRLAVQLSTMVVGVSNQVMKQLSGANVYRRPVPGGIQGEFFRCAQRQTQMGLGVFTVMAIGRLSIEKDWGTLIEAVGGLPNEIRRKVVINFYGEGDCYEKLVRLANIKNVKAVFHGRVSRHVLVDALGWADLSVLPSRFEGLGLSALEGMAAGVPTITSEFSSSNDFIVEGVTGNRFPIGDAARLSELIQWHMENPKDSKVTGNVGRKFVMKKYTEEIAYQNYVTIFKQIVL